MCFLMTMREGGYTKLETDLEGVPVWFFNRKSVIRFKMCLVVTFSYHPAAVLLNLLYSGVQKAMR